ncbi:MAG: citrate lyase acyl carrier protein [Negativicutes bacterium]|nr:citrate lyase acyl carrier protein [Negativicutes bacterium]
MANILRPGQAGTVESSDVMITLAPAKPGSGLLLELTSPVAKQYGEQIQKVIIDTLTEKGIVDALIHANDKGALDCTIRARLLAAIARASSQEVAQ